MLFSRTLPSPSKNADNIFRAKQFFIVTLVLPEKLRKFSNRGGGGGFARTPMGRGNLSNEF